MLAYLISDQRDGWWLVSGVDDLKKSEKPYVLQDLQAHLLGCREEGCMPTEGYSFEAAGQAWNYTGWLCREALKSLCGVRWGYGGYRVMPGGTLSVCLLFH